MSSIVTNINRHGRFTSSQVSKLIPKGSRPMTEDELKVFKSLNPKSRARNCEDGFSAAGLTYIEERYFERKRKRSLSNDAGSRATAWGSIMEYYVFSLLGLDYVMSSSETTLHKLYPNIWAGSSDLIATNFKIGEIKCYEAKKFCKYAEVLLSQDLEAFKNNFSDEYWQIVSNSCINNTPFGEAILYQPYDSEAEEIADFIRIFDYEEHDMIQYIYEFIPSIIESGQLYKLPFQPDDSEYQNLITFEFKVPQEDKDYLTSRILEAETFLQTKYYKK